MREGKMEGREVGEGNQGQKRSACVTGVPVNAYGGELAWGVSWWEYTEAL